MTDAYLLRNSRLRKSATGSSFHTILIYGDLVTNLGEEQNGRSKVKFRNRTGWIDKEDLGTNPILEVYFIDVGQGDSAFIVTPGRRTILIDGGSGKRALGFLAWKYRLSEVSASNPIEIDLVVLSHADEDHIGGLTEVISHPKIRIKKIVHSGLAVFKPNVHDTELGDLKSITKNRKMHKYLTTHHDTLAQLVDSQLSTKFLKWKTAIIQDGGNAVYQAVDANTSNIDIDDPSVSLEILGPFTERDDQNNKIFRWFGDAPHTVNGHSVILRLTCSDVKFLFPGDINVDAEEYLLKEAGIANQLDAHVLKAPHHGSHEFDRLFLHAVNPQISVISAGDNPDYGHPRAVFLGAIGGASRQPAYIFSTELAGNFVEVGKKLEKVELTSEEKKGLTNSALRKLRVLFKRRLHGMINVRTDGKKMFAARRVVGNTWWEHYTSDAPAQRSATN